LLVEAECASNPERTYVENVGDIPVFIDDLISSVNGVDTPVE
jgi:hypothetical protein